MHLVNARPLHRHRYSTGIRFLWHVTPASPTRIHQRSIGYWSRRHRLATAGRGPRFAARESRLGLIGELPSQDLATYGVGIIPQHGLDIVRLVTLVLVLMDHILFCRGIQFRVFLAISDDHGPA